MQKERMIWIDWAKAIGIVIVVFCHVPQGDSYFREICDYLQMPLFFFISGYLHKNQPTLRGSWSKYLKAIIIPYFLLQLLNYPYWLFKYFTDNGQFTGIVDCVVSPFIDCITANPIAGPTWYVCSILFLKLLTDALNRTRFADKVILLIVVCAIVAGFSINHYPLDHQINFTVLSTINFLPFYYFGYYAKKYNRMSNITLSGGIGTIVTTLLLVWLGAYVEFPNRLLFYLVGTSSVIAFLYLVQRIPNSNKVVETTSRGTIVILGLHWMFIGTLNYFVEKILHTTDIIYPTWIALVIAILICAILQIFILFSMKYFKAILGGR